MNESMKSCMLKSQGNSSYLKLGNPRMNSSYLELAKILTLEQARVKAKNPMKTKQL